MARVTDEEGTALLRNAYASVKGPTLLRNAYASVKGLFLPLPIDHDAVFQINDQIVTATSTTAIFPNLFFIRL